MPVNALQQAAEHNGRKTISRILRYYQGVAALRAGDYNAAAKAWQSARQAGLATPWADQNQIAFSQAQMLEPAMAGRWQDVITVANGLPLAGKEAYAEVIGLAHYHLGYDAAQAGRWSTAAQHWRAAEKLQSSSHLAQNLALAEEALGNWTEAARAWRQMVKRRPRKTDDPDYLSDVQVAAIWDHIAECYRQAGSTDEALTTLKTAAKYAPESVDQRLKLVDALVSENRDAAATNELERIVEANPQHEEALMRLGTLYKKTWGKDSMAIWRRVLAVNPDNTSAREELVENYLQQAQVEQDSGPRRFLIVGPRTQTAGIRLLEQALQEVPGHPRLLVEIGRLIGKAGKKQEARARLLEAFAAAPQDVYIIAGVLHELLHVDAGEDVTRLLPQARQKERLQPDFWIDQGKMVLGCRLGEDWAERFFAEAVDLVGKPWVDDTRAGVMLQICEAASHEKAKAVVQIYEQRLREEAPSSGALEYLAVIHAVDDKTTDAREGMKLVRKAVRVRARRRTPVCCAGSKPCRSCSTTLCQSCGICCACLGRATEVLARAQIGQRSGPHYEWACHRAVRRAAGRMERRDSWVRSTTVSCQRNPLRPRCPRGPVVQLQEALRCLRRGDALQSLALAERVLKAAESVPAPSSSAAAEAARQILAETHFRVAASVDDVEARLRHLDQALRYTPRLAKLHFYRALALWQSNRLPEAIPELDAAFVAEPARPWLAYMRQLARLASGLPWDAAGLKPAEANTLHVVAGILRDRPEPPSGDLPTPLLGKGTEMWQALAAMRHDPVSAPVDALQQATEHNGRKPLSRILRYYQGVAAFRAGDLYAAAKAWQSARQAGLTTPWADHNQVVSSQAQMLEPARSGRWHDVIAAAGGRSIDGQDPRAEMIALAHYHIGYDAAQAGHWATAMQHWRVAQESHGSGRLAQNLALAEEALGHWKQAAEAWREMAKRRPRKIDGPDYLSDGQVAAIWDHAAECYQKAEAWDEAVSTLRAAAKYAPNDVDQRLKLADTLMTGEREDAALKEIEGILESNPQHEEALMRLGLLYEATPDKDPLPIWRRVLALSPENASAREKLVQSYIRQSEVDTDDDSRQFTFLGPRTLQTGMRLLRQGLQEVPGDPDLLLSLGNLAVKAGQKKEARAHFLAALASAPEKVYVVGGVLHELLHADGGDEVMRLLAQARARTDLRPDFWIKQGEMVLDCRLGIDWAERFFAEAVDRVSRPGADDTMAGVMAEIRETAFDANAMTLARTYEQRLRQEAPSRGALEYLEVCRGLDDEVEPRRMFKLLRQALRAARAANDAGVLRRVQDFEEMLNSPMPSMEEMTEYIE